MHIKEINSQAKSLIAKTWQDHTTWQQNYTQAKALLEEALQAYPNNAITLTNYGTLLCDLGNHREAIQYLNKAIDLGSNDRHTFYNLGVALMNCSTHEKAMLAMQESHSKQTSTHTWAAYFDPMAH